MNRAAPIQVTILDQSRTGRICDAACGEDWFSPEVRKEALDRVHKRFGDKVSIEFLDLEEPQTRERSREIVDKVQSGELLLPLLMINGQVRIAGDFDLRMLVDMIDAQGELDVV